jgi:glutamyl-tRNA synthetase
LADRIPHYTHLPLIVGPDGRRLAKRHGDTRLATYRASGASAGQILRLLARWCGIEPATPISTAGDLVGQFDLSRLPRQNIALTADDESSLRPG